MQGRGSCPRSWEPDSHLDQVADDRVLGGTRSWGWWDQPHMWDVGRLAFPKSTALQGWAAVWTPSQNNAVTLPEEETGMQSESRLQTRGRPASAKALRLDRAGQKGGPQL